MSVLFLNLGKPNVCFRDTTLKVEPILFLIQETVSYDILQFFGKDW